MEPTITLLAIHSPVPHSISKRMGMPCNKNSARVPRHDAISGSQSLGCWAIASPSAILTTTPAAATQGDLVRRASADRTTDTTELATAVGLPNNAKCAT